MHTGRPWPASTSIPGSGPAVAIFDAAGALRETTPAARERMAQLGGSASGGVPHSVRMVAAAARAQTSGSRVPPLARVRGIDGRWILVRGALLGDGGADAPTVLTIEPADTGRTLELDLDIHGLTAREREVVRTVLTGVGSAEIAMQLGISVHTVQDHLKSVFAKIGVTSRRELVATLSGNVRPPSPDDRRA